jgi:polysaccharide pyruvyl transferase WcaK-like protein
MRIAIMGTPVTSGNRGVVALGASLIHLCSLPQGRNEVRLLVGNRDNQPASFRVGGQPRPIPVINCRLSPRSRLRDHLLWILSMSLLYRLVPVEGFRAVIARSTPWIKIVSEADLVGDVRGGDSFSDIYGLNRFLLSFLMAWTVLLVKGTMVQFPQTYGPYRTPVARWLARFLLRKSSCIIARDIESRKVAEELVGPTQEVLLSPDVAFCLEAVIPERIELAPPLSGPLPSGVIGLNVNGLMYNGGYTRKNMFHLKLDYADFLAELIAALLAEYPGELWLIPHTYAPRGHVESDNEASEKVRSDLPRRLQRRIRFINAEYDQHELKGIIGRCEFFIGSRMHSCIAALSQGIPCVGVAYSRKFAGVFESVGMEQWVVDARLCSNAESVSRTMTLYRRRVGVRSELVRRAAEVNRQLTEVFGSLLDELTPPPAKATR